MKFIIVLTALTALMTALTARGQTTGTDAVYATLHTTPTPTHPTGTSYTLFTNSSTTQTTPVLSATPVSLFVLSLGGAYPSSLASISLSSSSSLPPSATTATPPAPVHPLPVSTLSDVAAAGNATLWSLLNTYDAEFNPVASLGQAYGLPDPSEPRKLVSLPSPPGQPLLFLGSGSCAFDSDSLSLSLALAFSGPPPPSAPPTPLAVSETLSTSCASPATSCITLNNCSVSDGAGTCIQEPVRPYVSCACNPGRIGIDCSGEFFPVVTRGAAPPAPPVMPGFITVCAGARLEIHLKAPSSHDLFTGDVVTFVDFPDGFAYDFKFLSNDRHLIPDVGIGEAILDFDFVDPGAYGSAYVAVGSGYTNLGSFGLIVLPFGPPCHPPCDLANPLDACSGRGLCVAPGNVTAAATCVCNPSYFGPACEFGCTSENRTSLGGVIVDGSGPLYPATGLASCRWTVTPPSGSSYNQASSDPPTGYRIIFRALDIDPNSPLLFEAVDDAGSPTTPPPPIAISRTAIPTPFDVPAPFSLTFKENFFQVQNGFELVYFALGCPAGSFVDLSPSEAPEYGEPVCSPCPPGTFTDAPDSLECTPCRPGTVAPSEGTAECTPCSLGTFQSDPAGLVCLPCPVGTSAPSPGSSECVACKLGFYGPEEALSSCIRCPFSGYANSTGSVQCSPCPPFTAVPYLAAQSITECACSQGAYHPNASIADALTPIDGPPSGSLLFAATGERCLPCPRGASCNGGLTPPVPLPGFWASQSNPSLFLQCIESVHCPGGDYSTCSGIREGFLCSKCPSGYTISGLNCARCSPLRTAAVPIGIALGFVLLIFLYRIANINENDNLQSTLGLGTALGLYLQYLQFATLFRKFAISWPSSTDSMLSYFSFVNLDLSPLDLECSVNMSYGAQLTFRLLLPLLVAILFASAHVVHKLHALWVSLFGASIASKYPEKYSRPAMAQLRALIRVPELKASTRVSLRVRLFFAECLTVYQPMQWRRSVNAFLLFTEVFYIFVITAATELFGCMDNLSGKSVLVAHPSIYCYEDEWYALLPMAILALVVYVIILPAVYFYGARLIQKTEVGMDDTHFLAWSTFSSLVFKYKRAMRWWLFVILFRKLSISVVITSFPSEPLIQAVCSLAVLIVALIVQILHRPYRLIQHNQVDWVLSFLNILLIMCGILFYVDRWSDAASKVTEYAAAGLIGSAALYIIVVASVEAYRFVTDRPVDRASTTPELFARRHIPCPQDLRVVLNRLNISPKILFRYLAIASDDDLLMAVHFSQSIDLGRRQSLAMASSKGLIRWSSKYKVYQKEHFVPAPPTLSESGTRIQPTTPRLDDSWIESQRRTHSQPLNLSRASEAAHQGGLHDSWIAAPEPNRRIHFDTGTLSRQAKSATVLFADSSSDHHGSHSLVSVPIPPLPTLQEATSREEASASSGSGSGSGSGSSSHISSSTSSLTAQG